MKRHYISAELCNEMKHYLYAIQCNKLYSPELARTIDLYIFKLCQICVCIPKVSCPVWWWIGSRVVVWWWSGGEVVVLW
jgi:hypothetical protein